MLLVFGRDEEVCQFVAENLGVGIRPPYVAFGIVDDTGTLRGGIVYNHYNRFNIEISWYGPGTLTRPVLRAAFYEYPFLQLGVLRVTASTKRSNKLVCRLLPRLGFAFEGAKKRLYGPNRGDDAMVYRLDPDKAARWK